MCASFLPSVFAGAVAVGTDYHDHGENTQTVANLFKANGFSHVRMDIATGAPGAVTARMTQVITTFANNGIETEAIIHTSAGASVRNKNCPGDIPSLESSAYSEASQQVNTLKSLVKDFELENEVSLYPGINPLERFPSGPFKTAAVYDTVCARSMAAVLRGISRAISDVRTQSSLPLRRILGATSDGSSGFLLYMQQKGVAFDVVGLHVYPTENQANLNTDPWYGPGGFIGLFRQFGKPMHVNEFDCGEIYNSAYTNVAGSALTNACGRSITTHAAELLAASDVVERLDFYEVFDEPGLCANGSHECMFGLLYNVTTPKQQLDRAAAVAFTARPAALTVPAGLLSNAVYVTALYELLFGREPSASELNSSVNALQNGSITRDALQKAGLAASEHVARAAANNGSIPTSLTQISRLSYVILLYKALLQRVPSAAEVQSWVVSTSTREQMLLSFLASTEYVTRYR